MVSEKEVKTDFDGNFSILAKTDDLLVFMRPDIDYMRKIVHESDFDKGNILVYLTVKINQLEEVVINNYSNINAVSMGILQKPAKVLTVAERRLYTAQSEDALGSVINYFSGRTKMLKNNLVFERDYERANKLGEMFEEAYFVKTLKINLDQIRAFQFYASEVDEVKLAMVQKNKFLVAYALANTAKKFNELQFEK